MALLRRFAKSCYRRVIQAEIIVVRRILGMQHRLPSLDEGHQIVALVVLEALLVDRKIEIVDQLLDLLEAVFQGHSQTARARLVGDKAVVGQLVFGVEVKTGVFKVALHVVRLDRVTALGCGQVQTLGHEAVHIG